ncbi:MAG: hydroxylamine reductase [Candidatus Margulisiibacteriota bacterium]|jgi:hydroxylamine reductase
MFCYQCQETVKNQGCTIQGVCGKIAPVADLQDLLIYNLRGLSFWQLEAEKVNLRDPELSKFIIESLFTTLTNVNFDQDSILFFIKKAVTLKFELKQKVIAALKKQDQLDSLKNIPDAANWVISSNNLEDYLNKAHEIGILATDDLDIRSLKYLLIYGLKGMAAYLDHAQILGYQDQAIYNFVEEALAATLVDTLNVNDYLNLIAKIGSFGVQTLALLDTANTSTYSHPEITTVFTGLKKGPGILVSGHDLKDLAELLEQTKDKDINIYTHGEMLPANAYPYFKKYPHLIGNFGTSWYNQQKEFQEFKGAILMTTNCMQKPLPEYKDRIFTTGQVQWPEVNHISARTQNGVKDFGSVITKALAQGNLDPKEGKKLTIGFAHNTLTSVADKVVAAVKSGAIKRFVVMAGCDGRSKEREYFTNVALSLPKDTIILTAGCAKYRYNQLDLGDIDGIPRLLDAGQCNDSYSLVVIALKLKEAFGLEDLNQLPISFDIAWYEQKAVLILLTLLHLGIRNIHLGPTLPAFLSENILNAIVQMYNVQLIDTVDNDIEKIMAGR